MKTKIILFFLLIILFIFSFLLIFYYQPKIKANKYKIGVTIFPFYDLTKEIVGNKFEVILLAPTGSEIHHFDLSKIDIKDLITLKLLFYSGTTVDSSLNKIISNLKETKKINLSEKVNFIKINDEVIDPHYWLSLENMKLVALTIGKEMEDFDPANSSFYKKNLEKVIQKINSLQNWAQEELKNIKKREIVTQHNAFNYLAQELNLKIIGYFEEENKELTIEHLRKFFKEIENKKIKVIFIEPGEANEVLNKLTKEFNLKTFYLDPIEGKSGLDYFSAYSSNIKTLKEVLNQE